jgi:hypothetical protein
VFLLLQKHLPTQKLLRVAVVAQILTMVGVMLTAALVAATRGKMVRAIPTPTVKAAHNLLVVPVV